MSSSFWQLYNTTTLLFIRVPDLSVGEFDTACVSWNTIYQDICCLIIPRTPLTVIGPWNFGLKVLNNSIVTNQLDKCPQIPIGYCTIMLSWHWAINGWPKIPKSNVTDRLIRCYGYRVFKICGNSITPDVLASLLKAFKTHKTNVSNFNVDYK